MKKLRILSAVIAAILILAAGLYFFVLPTVNRHMDETVYTVYSPKVSGRIRLALLTDWHQNSEGLDEQALLERIRAYKPDLILIGGDLVNKKDTKIEAAVSFCGQLTQIAPVCYALGNHDNAAVYGNDLNKEFLESEGLSEGSDLTAAIVHPELLDQLAAAGVTVLNNDCISVDIDGNPIDICGVSTNASSFWPYSGDMYWQYLQEQPEHYKLLICHRPEVAGQYLQDTSADLIVSGHTHGGIIRLPGIGGLIGTEGDLFPEYDGGLYPLEHAQLVVSRGMGGLEKIPRIFNRPELVIIDIN